MIRLVIVLLLAGLPLLTAAQAKEQKAITIGTQLQLHSAILGEDRILNIYLPADYTASDTVKYHVLYLLDGSINEDFIHVAGLVQFNTFPWVKRLPPTIVVGIANTDRKRDMTFPTLVKADKEKYPTTGGSARFIDFLEKELKPFIDKNFRTGGGNTLLGQSLAGLLAAEVLLRKPDLFNNYIIISPSLWWDEASLLADRPKFDKAHPATPTRVYIGVGKEGQTPTTPPRIMEDDARMLADKIRAVHNRNVTLHFDFLPEDNHATVGHQAVMNGMRLLFGNTPEPSTH